MIYLEPETWRNARPFGSSMAERQRFGCLDTWPCSSKQIPTLRSMKFYRTTNNRMYFRGRPLILRYFFKNRRQTSDFYVISIYRKTILDGSSKKSLWCTTILMETFIFCENISKGLPCLKTDFSILTLLYINVNDYFNAVSSIFFSPIECEL